MYSVCHYIFNLHVLWLTKCYFVCTYTVVSLEAKAWVSRVVVGTDIQNVCNSSTGCDFRRLQRKLDITIRRRKTHDGDTRKLATVG